MAEGTTLAFVYGTLKKGFGNHRLLTTSRFIGKATTAPKYKLYNLGWFPGMMPNENGENVVGEIYEVTPAVLRNLDSLEGVPHIYRREDIEIAECSADLDGRPVQAYLYNNKGRELEPCGPEWGK